MELINLKEKLSNLIKFDHRSSLLFMLLLLLFFTLFCFVPFACCIFLLLWLLSYLLSCLCMVGVCEHREAHATCVWLEDSSQELVLSICLVEPGSILFLPLYTQD